MTWRVFYSYSNKDIEFRNQLGTYLAPLRHKGKITDWHDRKIAPGSDWQKEISDQLAGANLVLFLISADFLNSEYCLGVEVQSALRRLQEGTVKVVPILLRECLWQESVFSEIQMVPRGTKPVMSSASIDEAFTEVAKEIRSVIESSSPLPTSSAPDGNDPRLDLSSDLVRQQIRSYARLYERTRARMRPSSERTLKMEEIAGKMNHIALATYPLLDEFVQSPFPGERLAAVTILQTFSAEKYLGFLIELVGAEKPFVGYHAVKALRFAVDALEPAAYGPLLDALKEAGVRLRKAAVGFDADRQVLLRQAREQLETKMSAITTSVGSFD
jgi:TIR domain/HEAT repeats